MRPCELDDQCTENGSATKMESRKVDTKKRLAGNRSLHEKTGMKGHFVACWWIVVWSIVGGTMMVAQAERSALAGPVIRLFLVRHGQTEANRQSHVVGQGHSPLTEQGRQQAQALGRTSLIRDSSFWRMYASDLKRAQQTAHLVLGSAEKSTATLVLDERLEEISKGARQTYPKSFSYKEALEERLKLNDTSPIPKLESEDEGWDRMQSWLNDVVRDAVLTAKLEAARNPESPHEGRPYTVLAVAHAGIFRVFLRRLIGEDRLYAHPDAGFDPVDSRFAIPNTSLTILDVRPRIQDDGEPEPIGESFDQVNVVKLTWRGHVTEPSLIMQDATPPTSTL